jgi:RNA polymerase sigma-70 factor (ECF subfamily)
MDTTPRDLDALLAQAGWAKALARSLVCDPDRAEDLVQRAWLAALRNPPDAAIPPRRWLAAVMRNFVRDDVRESASRAQRERMVARPEHTPGSEPFDDAASAQARLLAAVRELPEPSRSAVWARYYEGLAPREIAARDGVPVDTVKTRIARGLDALRKRFDREHDGHRERWLAAFAPLAFGTATPSAPIGGDPSLASSPVATTLTTLAMNAKLIVAPLIAVVVCGSALWLASRDGDVAPLVHNVEPSPPLALAELETRSAPAVLGETASTRLPVAHDATPSAAPIAAQDVERHGLVVDLEQRPVAGLAILDGRDRQPVSRGDRPVTSDARGRFVIDGGVRVGFVTAGGAGWTTLYSTQRESPDAADDFVVVVARERSVRGSVVDAVGAPVAGAVVEHKVAEGVRLALGEILRGSVEMAFTTRTDEHGSFELLAPDAEARLEARAENHRSGSQALTGGDQGGIVVVLPPPEPGAIVLRGRVVDERGAGVERATVTLASTSVRTGADGGFTLSATRDALSAEQLTTRDGKPPVGLMPLVLRAAKRGQLPAERRLPALDELERVAQDETWLLVLGGPPLSIEGRIVDSDGKPVAGATVYLIDTQPFGTVEVEIGNTSLVSDQSIEQFLTGASIYQPRCDTDADGAFRFDGLQAREYRVDIGMHDIPATGTSAPIRAGSKGVDVVLDTSGPRADLAGRVVDRGGDPIAGARVHVAVTRPDSEDFIGGPSQTTDATGRFAFQRARGTQFRLQVELADIVAQPLEVLPGDRFDDLVITVARRAYVQVDLSDRPEFADSARLIDAHGETIPLLVMRTMLADGVATSTQGTALALPIVAGRSDVGSTAECDCTCVLTKDGVEVARIPVRLGARGVTIVRR